MTTSGGSEEFETIRVRVSLKRRLEEIKHERRRAGNKVTLSELIEEALAASGEAVERERPADHGLTTKQRNQLKMFIDLLRSKPTHPVLQRAWQGVIDDLTLWDEIRGIIGDEP